MADSKIELPTDPELATKVIDSQHAVLKQELGWLGACFGNAKEKPGNIAGLAIVLSFIMICAMWLISPGDTAFPVKDALTIFGGVLTVALGYLFGQGSR